MATDPEKGQEVISQFNLNQLLTNLNKNLESIDSRVEKLESPNSGIRKTLMDILKTLVGGWPAFGLVFLFMFYTPLKEALNSIPDKVRHADEITVAGVSLKSTFKQLARGQGMENLGDVIPKLSEEAIELLLQVPDYGQSLVSFSMSEDGKYNTSFYLPNDQTVASLEELEANGLIEVRGHSGGEDSITSNLEEKEIGQTVEDILNRYPGHKEESHDPTEFDWVLNTKISDDSVRPYMTWSKTEYGERALNVIIEAVSKSLAK